MLFGADRELVLRKLQVMQEWLLIAYAISLPLTMTGSWALLTAGVIAWAVEFLVRTRVKAALDHGVYVTPELPLKWPLAAFALAVFSSGFANPTGSIADAFRSIWALKAIVIYFWASKVFHFSPRTVNWSIQSLLCVSAIAGIWGTIQQVLDFHPFGYRYLQGTGFLSGPMAFAGQMQMFALLSMALLLTDGYKHLSGKLSNRKVFVVIAFANLLGLLFAGEKSAWLGGLTAIMVLTAALSWKVCLRTTIVLFVTVLISWQVIPLVHTRIDSMLSGQQDVSTRVRLVVWKNAIEQWQTSPIFGIGFMNFPRLDIPEAIVPGVSKDINHAHSNYLQILATTGILGAITYAILCIAMLHYCVKSYLRARRAKDELAAGLAVGTLAAMVSLIVSGLFEFNFGTAQVRLAQWFILALLAHTPEGAGDHTVEPRDSVPDSLPSV